MNVVINVRCVCERRRWFIYLFVSDERRIFFSKTKSRIALTASYPLVYNGLPRGLPSLFVSVFARGDLKQPASSSRAPSIGRLCGECANFTVLICNQHKFYSDCLVLLCLIFAESAQKERNTKNKFNISSGMQNGIFRNTNVKLPLNPS